ncbi:MAG: putative minor tail protein [Oscillospiraceae bacterium]|nr:putative minor tail protein [Oscillospiraceae bacterium]
MTAYDGTIRISTAIDTKGVEDGITAVQEALEALKTSVMTVKTAVKEIFSETNGLQELWDGLDLQNSQFWNELASLESPIDDWFPDSIDLSTLFSGILDDINTFFAELPNQLNAPFSTLNTYLSGKLDELSATVSDKLDGMKQNVTGTLDEIQLSVEAALSAVTLSLATSMAAALLSVTVNTALIDAAWLATCLGISTQWYLLGKPALVNMQNTIQETGDLISSVLNDVILPDFVTIGTAIDNLWISHVLLFWTNLQSFGQWFGDTFQPGFLTNISIISTAMTSAFTNGVTKIGEFQQALMDLMVYLTVLSTGDWYKVWLSFLDSFNLGFGGLGGVAKVILNALILTVNTVLDGLTLGLNGIIKALNSLSFTVPDWVPEFGGETWGFSIPTVTATKIPYLATGAVLPANNPFLAVVGDQKNGTNVEAPLATIQEAVVNAIAQLGLTGGSGTYTFNLTTEIDGKTVANKIVKYLPDAQNRVGTSIVKVGST